MNKTQVSVAEFGRHVKELAKSETSVKLAERLGISRTTLHGLMNKGQWPSFEVCEQLGVVLVVADEERRRGKK